LVKEEKLKYCFAGNMILWFKTTEVPNGALDIKARYSPEKY
jgi:hypothetical protein